MSDVRDRLDDIEQFVERTEGNVYPRRVFLGMCGAMGLAPVVATAMILFTLLVLTAELSLRARRAS